MSRRNITSINKSKRVEKKSNLKTASSKMSHQMTKENIWKYDAYQSTATTGAALPALDTCSIISISSTSDDEVSRKGEGIIPKREELLKDEKVSKCSQEVSMKKKTMRDEEVSRCAQEVSMKSKSKNGKQTTQSNVEKKKKKKKKKKRKKKKKKKKKNKRKNSDSQLDNQLDTRPSGMGVMVSVQYALKHKIIVKRGKYYRFKTRNSKKHYNGMRGFFNRVAKRHGNGPLNSYCWNPNGRTGDTSSGADSSD